MQVPVTEPRAPDPAKLSGSPFSHVPVSVTPVWEAVFAAGVASVTTGATVSRTHVPVMVVETPPALVCVKE